MWLGHPVNLLSFVANSPLNRIDPLGLEDQDPCVDAQEKLKPGSSEGGALVCHKGKLLACAWNKGKDLYKMYPGLLKCTQAHEDEHLKQNPNLTCEPCKTSYAVLDPKKVPKDECGAYGVEADCLKKEQKTACGTDYDPTKKFGDLSECEKEFRLSIDIAEPLRDASCNQAANIE
jgi:hypothetical protein